jgi:hypothetical protein
MRRALRMPGLARSVIARRIKSVELNRWFLWGLYRSGAGLSWCVSHPAGQGGAAVWDMMSAEVQDRATAPGSGSPSATDYSERGCRILQTA